VKCLLLAHRCGTWLLCLVNCRFFWTFYAYCFYSAFSSAIFMMIPVTISIVVRQGYVALLIPFVWIFLSMFWQTNNFIFSIDLIPRLFYGSYFSSLSSRVINLSTSLIYLSLVGIACYLAGGYMIKRTDF